MTAYDPELMIYEEPSSMEIADWEDFCQQMREEAAHYPDSQNVRLTLQSAERTLKQVQTMWGEIDAKAA